MHVQTIPMCEYCQLCERGYFLADAAPAVQDNYAYLLSDDKTKDAFVIDPASSREYAHTITAYRSLLDTVCRVIPVLAKLTSAGSINFKGILSTHQ